MAIYRLVKEHHHVLMGKSTISNSMAIFNSYVSVPEDIYWYRYNQSHLTLRLIMYSIIYQWRTCQATVSLLRPIFLVIPNVMVQTSFAQIHMFLFPKVKGLSAKPCLMLESSCVVDESHETTLLVWSPICCACRLICIVSNHIVFLTLNSWPCLLGIEADVSQQLTIICVDVFSVVKQK